MPGGGGGTAGGGKRGSNLNFHKPSEPAFLKRFKEKVGYKEKVTTIDDKVSITTFHGLREIKTHVRRFSNP